MWGTAGRSRGPIRNGSRNPRNGRCPRPEADRPRWCSGSEPRPHPRTCRQHFPQPSHRDSHCVGVAMGTVPQERMGFAVMVKVRVRRSRRVWTYRLVVGPMAQRPVRFGPPSKRSHVVGCNRRKPHCTERISIPCGAMRESAIAPACSSRVVRCVIPLPFCVARDFILHGS